MLRLDALRRAVARGGNSAECRELLFIGLVRKREKWGSVAAGGVVASVF